MGLLLQGVDGTVLQEVVFLGNSLPTCTDCESGEDAETIPEKFELYQNFPNPFNNTTKIKFSILKPSHVSLKIYDYLGKQVSVLVNQNMSPGIYTTAWNAENLASGMYFYEIQVDDNRVTKKMMLVK